MLRFRMVCLLALLASAPLATKAGVTFNLDREFSGGTEPQGGSPWITLELNQVGGDVGLTVNSGLVGLEFLTGLYLNLNPALDAADLSVSHLSGVAPGSISTQDNGFKAAGAGHFDVLIKFPTKPGQRFGAGDSSEFLMSTLTSLVVSDFTFTDLLLPKGTLGSFFAAGHIQGIGFENNQSGWISTTNIVRPPTGSAPESGTLSLFALGLGVIIARRRRRPIRSA